MALSFTGRDETPVPLYTAPCRLWLTLDGRIVPDGDLDAHALLIRAGGSIPLADALRYGLVSAPEETPAPVAAPPVVAEQAAEPAQDAAVADVAAQEPVAEAEPAPVEGTPEA